MNFALHYSRGVQLKLCTLVSRTADRKHLLPMLRRVQDRHNSSIELDGCVVRWHDRAP